MDKTDRSGKKRWLKKPVFQDILYAQCWEDPQIDRDAFCVGPEDVIFSISSGGCNVLAFLIDDPKAVISLDLNPYQNYLLELKMAAFKALDYESLLRFLGVVSSSERLKYYQKIREWLSTESQLFWDRQHDKMVQGVIHCGRFERFIGLLRRILVFMHGRSMIEKLFTLQDTEERRVYFESEWNNWGWKLLTGLFLSRTFVTLMFDKAFYAQLEDSFSFSKHFRHLTEHALVDLPIQTNYFLSYMLLGRFHENTQLPLYLRKEHFATIRDRIDRIQLIHDDCGRYLASSPSDSITKFNFTNVFEWMTPKVFEDILKETIRVAKHGAIITYRNHLVSRSRPDSLARWIESMPAQSEFLHDQDLSFIYKAYIVERIVKEKNGCPTE